MNGGAWYKSDMLHNSIYMTFNNRGNLDIILEVRTVVTPVRRQQLRHIMEASGCAGDIQLPAPGAGFTAMLNL